MNGFTRFSLWLNKAMAGRYGGDAFSAAQLVLYCVLLLLSSVFRSSLLFLLAIAILVWCLFRMLSRNQERRRNENGWFLRWWSPVWRGMRGVSSRFRRAQEYATAKARDRGVYRYYKCPKCKNKLRVPKGKGRIAITCPVCRTEFVKRT